MSNEHSIFITGAAAGIGAEIARRFLSLGWRVGAYDIAQVDATKFPQGPGELVTGTLDVTDPGQWDAALAEFCGVGGTLDVLVNNAGILFAGPFEETAIAQHQATINVNVNGTINGCYTAHEYLFRTKNAVVVNLCSASAIYGQAELATYSASKFAVRGLTEGLEIEWQNQDIRVLALWPLFVQTNLVAGIDIGSTRSLGINLGPDDVADELVKAVLSPPRLPKVHYPVGGQAKIFANLSQVTPAWANRLMNKKFASK